MSAVKVLLVAGTHGNELNAPWLFEKWSEQEELINSNGVSLARVIGNPDALALCRRYIERDLNRSFKAELIQSSSSNQNEVIRAKQLLNIYGPLGINPCQIAIDFHSTTSSMGTSLVVYGRRPKDLALAALIQHRIGVPIYLHEGDEIQNGFLVESWPCGLVVEIGPVPQGLIHQKIINQTKLSIEICLEEIAKIPSRENIFPENLIVHRHLQNIDYPRDSEGRTTFFIHENIQNKDWFPIKYGEPLFENLEGQIITNLSKDSIVPVFINEAAYIEKNIAMAFTKKEIWQFDSLWSEELKDFLNI
tara:strand:+ start:24301 stop:25215 length:915 start_codon:yes stop_codon:yes gene_type:complete